MTDSGAVLKETMAQIRALMKSAGFAYKKGVFHRVTESGNVLSVLIQKGIDATQAQARVTITYGVTSRRVAAAFGDEVLDAPDVWSAHWRGRLQGSDGAERWITVSATDKPAEVVSELKRSLDDVVADLQAHASDESLEDLWLAGQAGGLTRSQRLLFLVALLRDKGPREEVVRVVHELRTLVTGTPRAGVIEAQLRALGLHGV